MNNSIITNGCYPEKISDIPKLKGVKTPSGEMLVNMEWGNFNCLTQTLYDLQLDLASATPGLWTCSIKEKQ